MPRVEVEKVQGPAKRRVLSGLIDYNDRAVGRERYKPFTVTLRQGKEIVGGVIGWTWKGWCHIDLVWIDDKYRGHGQGTALLRVAEAEARKRGVDNIFLDSFSFQAPGFYKKLGFRQFGMLKDFPKGHNRHFLHKAL